MKAPALLLTASMVGCVFVDGTGHRVNVNMDRDLEFGVRSGVTTNPPPMRPASAPASAASEPQPK